MNSLTAMADGAWAAVAGTAPAPRFLRTGSLAVLPSALPAGAVAVATISAALGAAGALHGQRTGRSPALGLDISHAADAVRSERLFRVDARPAGATFDALSRFWRTADGAVRTHANYPWHRTALLRALNLPGDADADAVATELARRPGADVEDRVFAAGGIAVRVRTAAQWREHPQGRAVGAEPLVGLHPAGPAAPRERPAADRPAAGVRVLDLTRVIAGPVCTRFLGALGADVLRLDPPGHDDVPPGSYADTLLGKRSAALDLATGGDLLAELLDGADVLVCGYRPGSLDRFGLTDDALAARHPGLVVVRIAAWGHTGPWRHRRGFDSVVQAGAGIADVERDPDGRPGVLPCQLLDHGTGYLAAAAALDGLRRQSVDGGTLVRRLSLARTAAWLLDAPRDAPVTTAPATAGSWTAPVGPVDAVTPPGRIDHAPLRWPQPPARYLAARPGWA